ncbi:FkbM family methyltransferase [Flavobacterium sp. 7A]|uniref:FkbM family methyltransferase n=1 Tax=Flavobacterium sp. 7A TaxID=2940571 RepID=UPI002226EBED|nr:FkbM family methyltransferase [Flavobacterium sp. 7A]MCW2119229.1 FkbM family methyltransferase [Flavobacterium sp. 7A]
MKLRDLFGIKKKVIVAIEEKVEEKVEELEEVPTDREYQIGKYKLLLKDFHVLDLYQNTYPLYDQFLPAFCKNFKGLIIDVGANIGDTAISIFAQNNHSFIVSVEPDLEFVNSCISSITDNGLVDRSLIVNKFVSTKTGNFVVKKNESLSTGSIEECETDENKINNTLSFSELMDLIPNDKKNNFDILKIDTDSFDWDIIHSFVQYVKKDGIKPRFVFFEMQTFINNNESSDEGRDVIIENYRTALIELKELGYIKFCLLDNFGTYFKTTESVEEIIELAHYIRRSQLFNSHSTIYYFDVLAYAENEMDFVKNTLIEIY